MLPLAASISNRQDSKADKFTNSSMTKHNCPLNQPRCGLEAGNPLCPKCGLDTSVRYVSQEAGEAALASAMAQYQQSDGEPDFDQARDLLRTKPEAGVVMLKVLAEQGDVRSMNHLGYLYASSSEHYMERNEKLGYYWYQRAALAGDLDGMTTVAWKQSHGIGTDKDLNGAHQWLILAADKGYSPGILDLAKWNAGVYGYDDCLKKLPRDFQKARVLLKQVVEKAAHEDDYHVDSSAAVALAMLCFGASDVVDLNWSTLVLDRLVNRPAKYEGVAFNAIKLGLHLKIELPVYGNAELSTFSEETINVFGVHRASKAIHELARELRYGHSPVEGDATLSHKLLALAAGWGDLVAQTQCAHNLRTGDGVEADTKAALISYLKLAEDGVAEALVWSGCLLRNVDKNPELAKHWFDKASALDLEPDISNMLAGQYLEPGEPIHEPSQAYLLYRRLAEKNVGTRIDKRAVAWACQQVGFMCARGNGTQQSRALADQFFDAAIELQDSADQKAKLTGKIAKRFWIDYHDRSECLRWMERAGNSGHIGALRELAGNYSGDESAWGLAGNGKKSLFGYFDKELEFETNPEIALQWWRKAAEFGDLGAQVVSGYLLAKGIGCEVDRSAAALHFDRVLTRAKTESKPQNCGVVLLQVALHFAQGIMGDENKAKAKDFILAATMDSNEDSERVALELLNNPVLSDSASLGLQLLQLLAEAGSLRAIKNLVGAYARGQGTTFDLNLASIWSQKYCDLFVDDRLEYYKKYPEATPHTHKSSLAEAAEDVVKELSYGDNFGKRYSLMMAWLEKGANAGDFEACLGVGMFAASGLINARDINQARLWFQKAYELEKNWDAKRGEKPEKLISFHKAASKNYSYHFFDGFCINLTIPISHDIHRELNTILAKDEDVDAQMRLGNMFLEGFEENDDATERHFDYFEAYYWFDCAANNGSAEGLYAKAMAYYYGRGTDKDSKKFIDNCTAAAMSGHIAAILQLADASLNGDKGLPQSDTVANQWCEKAQHAGGKHSDILYVFSSQSSLSPQAKSMLIDWLRRGISLDDKNCNYSLAKHYANGDGIAVDEAGSDRLLEKYAHDASGWTYWQLANDFVNGVFPRNELKAILWLRKAAGEKYPEAMEALGDAFAYGFGVTSNPKSALNWWLQAAEVGRPAAKLKAATFNLRWFGGDAVAQSKMWVEACTQLPNSQTDPWFGMAQAMLKFVDATCTDHELNRLLARALAHGLPLAFELQVEQHLRLPNTTHNLELARSSALKALGFAKRIRSENGFVGLTEIERLKTKLDEISSMKPLGVLATIKVMLTKTST